MLVSSKLCRLAEQVKKLGLIEAEILSLRCRLNSHSSNYGHCVYNSSYCCIEHSARTFCTLQRTRYSRISCTSVCDSVRFFNDDSGDKSDESNPFTEDVSELAVNEKPDLTDDVVKTDSIACYNTISEQNVVLEAETEQQKKSCPEFNAYSFKRNVESYLADSGIPYNEGYTCFTTVCPKLGKLAMKKRREEDILYVNSTSGSFYCQHCGRSGSWSQLKDNIALIKTKKIKKNIECFKDVVDVTRTTDHVHPLVEKHLQTAENFSTMSDETFEIIQSIFDWHGVEKIMFEKYEVKYRLEENKYWVIFPIYSPVGVVTSVSVYCGWVTDDGDIKTAPVQIFPRSREKILPFGWQQLSVGRESKNVVITSSEANALAINQATSVMALALKNLSQLPQEVLPHLENYNKITLWVGTDIKAWENAKMFAKKLNEKRCYIFKPNMVQKMPLEVLQKGDNIEEVLNKARLISHKAILTFENLKQEVYSEFAQYNQVSGVKWSRYSKLNQIFKGHRRGELTVLTGPTGCGKTTFLSDYSLDLCMQGVNTLWGSFEISNVRLVKMMMQQFAGKNITKHLDDFDRISEDFSMLPLYFMVYFGVEEMEKILEAMSHAVYVHDISHVIVDNLQFLMGMDFTEKNRFIKQDKIVAAFRKFATEKNCHVTLIIHPRKINEGEELSTASIFGSAKVTQEADNIIIIQDQRLTKPSGRKYIQIAKNRFDGDLGVMTLTFNKDSLTFNTVEKKKAIKTKEISYMDSEAETEL